MKKELIAVGNTYVSRDARVREVVEISRDGYNEKFVVYRSPNGAKGTCYISSFQRWAVGFAKLEKLF
jgi:hypothetical protein